jgi:predicted MFS family arabinose efflux permease
MLPEQSPKRELRRAAAIILVLALAPAIGVGIARFAYSLLLPDMRASLGWSYAAAGFMNAINAAGYLVGALIAAPAMRRTGRFGAIFYGSLACVAALALSAASANFLVLSAARLAAGIGGAIAFVGGGVEAARLSQRYPTRAAFLLSLYYIGPGLGIVISGLITPLLLTALGAGTWWIAWAVLAAITAMLSLLLLFARSNDNDDKASQASAPAPVMEMAPILVSYCLFSIGTIAYMTFMIAWLVNGGAGATTQSAFWSLLGLGGIYSPVLWSWTVSSMRAGRAIALLTVLTFIATAVALFVEVRVLQLVAAFGFGSLLLAVVAATTAFVRLNLPSAAWPSGVGAMTVAFGLGQTVGPLLSGAISDASGDLALGLQCCTALLAFAALLALFQRDLALPGRAR